jgi:hypothetical protein
VGRNITHAGAVGYFAKHVAAAGLIGIVMTASKPLMAYPGAKGEVASTNPLAIAAPSADTNEPIVLDMSTAAVALGKIMAARDAGRPIPDGPAETWMQPTIRDFTCCSVATTALFSGAPQCGAGLMGLGGEREPQHGGQGGLRPAPLKRVPTRL